MTGWRDYLELRGMVRAMSDVVRLNILHQLAGGRETNVTDLVLNLGISQPLVSWHLRILRRHGLVRTRRQGREVYCSLDAARVAACLRELGDLVASPAAVDPAPVSPVPVATSESAESEAVLAGDARPSSRAPTGPRSQPRTRATDP